MKLLNIGRRKKYFLHENWGIKTGAAQETLFVSLHFCMTAQVYGMLDQELLWVCEKGNLNRSDNRRPLQHLKPATLLALG